MNISYAESIRNYREVRRRIHMYSQVLRAYEKAGVDAEHIKFKLGALFYALGWEGTCSKQKN